MCEVWVQYPFFHVLKSCVFGIFGFRSYIHHLIWVCVLPMPAGPQPGSSRCLKPDPVGGMNATCPPLHSPTFNTQINHHQISIKHTISLKNISKTFLKPKHMYFSSIFEFVKSQTTAFVNFGQNLLMVRLRPPWWKLPQRRRTAMKIKTSVTFRCVLVLTLAWATAAETTARSISMLPITAHTRNWGGRQTWSHVTNLKNTVIGQ